MCGIVGYIGKAKVSDAVLDALSRLEYRGYDSAGLAVLNNGSIEVRKRVGKLKELARDVGERPMNGQIGIGHCLSGDTLVQLPDGRAARLDRLPERATVLSLDPKTLKAVYRPASVWRHRTSAELIEVQVPFGALRCTPQHRLLTVDAGGRVVVRRASEFKRGDVLLHARTWEVTGLPQGFRPVAAPRYYRVGGAARTRLRAAVARFGGMVRATAAAGVSPAAARHLWEPDRNVAEAILEPLSRCLGLPFPLASTEPIHSARGNFVRFPEYTSPEIMQWLGYYLGDGYAGRRGVRFKDADRDTLAAYQALSARCFNLRGRVVAIPGVRAHLLELNSQALVDWLRVNVGCRREGFIESVGRLPTEELAAFLRGLFDAEGTVARQAGQVKLAMTDLELVRRIQLWLLRLGIVASLSHTKACPAQRREKSSLSILITRQDALAAFVRTIGFSSARKRARLREVSKTKLNGWYLSSRAVPVPVVELLSQLRRAGVPSTTLRPFRGGARPTDGQAQRLAEALKGMSQAGGVARTLERWLQSDIQAQVVLSVRRARPKDGVVYDLEVEGTENFFANGIVSHNSRWATHGLPTEANAHPHTDCHGKLAVVHNGIIENYAQLKAQLQAKRHVFSSKTDTEVIPHLIEEFAKQHPLPEAFRLALKELRGSYAVCALSSEEPRRIFGARSGSPLIVGVGKGEAFFASDVPAILARTRRVIYLNDQEIVELSADGPRITTLAGKAIRRQPTTVAWNIAAARKGGFPHFMLKEIHEQATAIEQTLFNRLDPAKARITFDRRTKRFLDGLSPQEKFVIIACGTAYHAGLVGEYMLEEHARLPVDVDLASEFRYRGPMLDRHTTVLAITQSGETADTLAGVRLAKERGAKVLAICNVMGSSIPREADAVLYTHAGPEIAVASTKAYTCQITALALLTLYLARRRQRLPGAQWRRLVQGLADVPRLVDRALAGEANIKAIAAKYAGARNFYYLGRRYNFPSALEGALKLKEICPLIHAEGYAAGEMKHGPISLIRQGWPIVFLATQSPVYEKVISNIEEVRARRGECIVVASEGDEGITKYADALITVPKTEELFSPILAAIPLQLFAYYVADANGCDIDQPPNLAKSVTVE